MINNKLLLAALALAPLTTQAVESTYTFESISVIRQRQSTTAITGILIDSTPMTVSFPAGSTPHFTDRCERMLGSMLNQPGAYLLTVTIDISTPQPSPANPIPVPITTLLTCQLDVKP